MRQCFFRTAILFMSIAPVPLGAQNGTTAGPQFEVASIKPSAPGSRGPTIYNPTRGLFAIDSIATKALIAYAYDVREFQVSGGPSWVGSQEYNIVAKPQGEASNEKILAMARSLLAERFNLTLHHESKRNARVGAHGCKGRGEASSLRGHGRPPGSGREKHRRVDKGE